MGANIGALAIALMAKDGNLHLAHSCKCYCNSKCGVAGCDSVAELTSILLGAHFTWLCRLGFYCCNSSTISFHCIERMKMSY
jgi:hypothetical protein